MSNATGKLAVTPVCNFDQSDLCVDDIMLLDTVASVFVWVGPEANAIERTEVRLVLVGAHRADPGRTMQSGGEGRGEEEAGGVWGK